jgi:hypothetical protein
MSAAPALADKPAPEYSLSIVEGANTQPEDSIQHVSASALHPRAEVVVSIAHNGLVVAQDKGDGDTWLSQAPQVGDVVTLESPEKVVRGAVVYDGLPSLDPTVCAGSTNFSGQRSANETVEGGYYTVVPHPSYFARRGGGLAQVQLLSGSAFAGGFLTPLIGGETVYVVESLISPIDAGTFAYSSENDRPVGACPVPPPPPPPPPPLALAGSVVKLVRTSIHRLIHFGWSTQVTINQPGTIVENLYLRGGALPAFAATRKYTASEQKRRRRKPPALLLARGRTTSKAAGTVKVTLHLTTRGRHLLRHARSVKVVLVTTLSTALGAKLTLEHRSLTLHR